MIRPSVGLVLTSVVSILNCQAASFATRVVNYEPGGLPSTVASYTNTASVVGEPSRVTPGDWGGPVDPFSPPWAASQLLILGTNGSVTLELAAPIADDPGHLFGRDFILFSGSGLIITNGDYSGGGITDGTIFGNGSATPQIEVSADGVQFYSLEMPHAISGFIMWPTDGEGSFGQPIDPSLLPTALAGQNLAGIRKLYQGSAGGAAYDLAWAKNETGQSAGLRTARFVRITNPDDVLKIDGVATVETPATIAETFAEDPAIAGWQTFGKTNLFQWDATRQAMKATWDSSQPNSFFYRPLGMTLNKQDDFALSFDLTLDTVSIGQTPDKEFTFELALGFINRANAFATNFIRGTGVAADAPNLVEFDYFPDSGFGATISTAITSDSLFLTANSYPLELTTGAKFHVELQYDAASHVLKTAMTRDGQTFGPIKDLIVKTNFTNFAVDAVAISSYSDIEADGSILAAGWVDNLQVSLPTLSTPEISGRLAATGYEISFPAKAGWFYALERSTDLMAWKEVANQAVTATGNAMMVDSLQTNGPAWYRLRAVRQ